jgi:hypothetical protein
VQSNDPGRRRSYGCKRQDQNRDTTFLIANHRAIPTTSARDRAIIDNLDALGQALQEWKSGTPIAMANVKTMSVRTVSAHKQVRHDT